VVSSQLMGSGPLASTETDSPPHGFTPLHQFVASDAPMSSPESISAGSAVPGPLRNPMSPHHPTTDSDALPPPPPPPPTDTPPDDAEFNKDLMKKLGIVTGVAIVGGTLATLLGLEIKHHEHEQRGFQDS
jgi:hypothetical protein